MEKINNNILLNKTGFANKVQGSVFGNVYVIIFILIISLIFIGVAVYYYIQNSNVLKIVGSSSYYGSDIANYEPVFQDTSKTIADCINICINDLSCDGITYNADTKECLGTKNGQIRNETSNYSAWVKPPTTLKSSIKKDFSKSVIVGYTKSSKNINAQKIQNPYIIGTFCYSFNLTIFDFNKNYGSWRHLFHKGSQIDTGTVLTYQSWENLVLDFPVQTIGVWLAPFTNNLRIAVTTTSLGNRNQGFYKDAFVEKCDQGGQCYITDMPSGKWVDRTKSGDGSIDKLKINTYVEFFDHDLQNIPINRQTNITINFRGNDVEVYFNGKIVKIARLNGIATINKSNLYVMNENTFGGEISNLLYYPDALKLQDIQDIIALAPVITD
jgi:hypothetical protein